MTENNQGVPPIVLYAIIGVMAWMLWSKPQEPAPGPVDPPKPKVQQVVAKILPEIKEGYKAVFAESAAKVDAKEIASAEQLSTFLKKGLENVRIEASGDFDGLLNDNVPTEFSSGPEAAAVAGFLRRVAASW